MRVVAFLSEDAGVGKSLLACHLAVEAMRATDRPTVLVEVGIAGALAAWRGRRVLPTPRVIRVEPADLGATLERLHGEGVGLAVLDTPAPPSSLHGEVLSWADLVVLPVAPRREALESVGRIVRFLEGQGAPFTFVVNRAGAAHKFTAAYAMALAQHGTVCPIVIGKRPDFAEAFTAGLTVGEVEDEDGGENGDGAYGRRSEAAKIASDFWRFIDTMLTRLCGADTPPRPSERGDQRNFPRWPLDWHVVVARGADRFPCRLVDLSGAGAGLEIEADLAVDDMITLTLPSFGDFAAVVVRTGNGRTGVRLILDAERQWRLAETLAARMQAPAAPPAAAVAEAAAEVSPVPIPAAAPSSPAPTGGRTSRRLTTLIARVGVDKPPSDGAGRPGRTIRGAGADRRSARGRIVVIGNEKGGCGKSTLAVHLAIALIKDGFDVATVDLDPRQATFGRYLENRRAFAAAKATDLAMPATHATPNEGESDLAFCDLLTDLGDRHAYVVVDTPGRDARLPRLAHTLADVVLTPINDSFLDLDPIARLDAETSDFMTAGPYGELVRAARTRAGRNGAPDWIVVRNRLTTVLARNKADMAEAVERLAERMGFRIGPGLTERVIYRELFPFGLTLLDLRDEGVAVPMTLSHVAARQEVRALMHLVLPPERAEGLETRAAVG